MEGENFEAGQSPEKNWDEEYRRERIAWLERLLRNWPDAPPLVRKIWEEELTRLRRVNPENEN
jgi:hypothetical protein